MSAAVDAMLAGRAAGGDGEALEAVLGAIKDDVYRLSVRMLGIRPTPRTRPRRS